MVYGMAKNDSRSQYYLVVPTREEAFLAAAKKTYQSGAGVTHVGVCGKRIAQEFWWVIIQMTIHVDGI